MSNINLNDLPVTKKWIQDYINKKIPKDDFPSWIKYDEFLKDYQDLCFKNIFVGEFDTNYNIDYNHYSGNKYIINFYEQLLPELCEKTYEVEIEICTKIFEKTDYFLLNGKDVINLIAKMSAGCKMEYFNKYLDFENKEIDDEDDDNYLVECKNDVQISCKKSLFKYSEFLYSLLDDRNTHSIQLDFDSNIVYFILEFLEFRSKQNLDYSSSLLPKLIKNNYKDKIYIILDSYQDELNFIEKIIEKNLLNEMIYASNYLGIKDLLYLLCWRLSYSFRSTCILAWDFDPFETDKKITQQIRNFLYDDDVKID